MQEQSCVCMDVCVFFCCLFKYCNFQNPEHKMYMGRHRVSWTSNGTSFNQCKVNVSPTPNHHPSEGKTHE